MLSDEILEKIFSDPEMQTLPIGAQATAVEVVGRVLEQIKEEKPYANISALLSGPNALISELRSTNPAEF